MEMQPTEEEIATAALLGVHLHQFSNYHPKSYAGNWTVCNDLGANQLMHLSCSHFAKTPREALDAYIDKLEAKHPFDEVTS